MRLADPSPPPRPAIASEPGGEIALGRRLARRLSPVAIGIGLLVSLAPPAAEYAAESPRLESAAASYARDTAGALGAVLVEGRDLARTRRAVFDETVRDILGRPNVISVRVLDDAGRVVPGYERRTSQAWWNFHAPVGFAPILAGTHQVGTVEIAISRGMLVRSVLTALLVSVSGTVLLGAALYIILFRIVTGMEVRIQDLIGTLRHANRSSEALRVAAERSAQQLRDILQDVDAIVWAAELPSGHFLFVSERAEVVLGYPVAQWTTEPNFWIAHLHPEDRDAVRAVLAAAGEGESDFDIEHRAVAADGCAVWLRNRMHVFRDADGRALQLRGVMTDITERKRAESALKNSQEQYRSLVENVKQVIFQTDARGRWTLLNSAWTELTGFSVEESLQKLFLDYVHPEDRRRHAEFFQPLMRGESRYLGQEVRYLTKAGGYRWVEVYSRLTVDGEGRIAGTSGTLTDITERKQGAEELTSAQERLRHLLVSSPAVIHSREARGDFPVTFVGQNISRLFGYDVEELLGDPQRWTAIIHPDDTARVLGDLARIVEDEEQSHEYRLRRKDGKYRWVRDEWRLIRDSAGKPVEIVGSLADVTDSKQGEEERARLSSVVEQSNEAVVITDLDGDIVYVNSAWERLTGFKRAEVVGLNARILKSGKHDPEFYRTLWTTLVRGGSWAGHLINQRKDRSLFEGESTISPVRDAGGRLVNYVQLLRDVTREKQIEDQLRQSQKMEAVGRLAGGVAHDFNNLLTIIMGRGQLLLARLEADSPLKPDVDLVLKTADRAAALTRQLLAFSRKQVLAMTVLDLNVVVGNMEQMLRRLIGEDVELVTTLAPGLGRVKADPGQIEQVIMNLAVNSRDAMPRGGRLTIETADVADPSGQLPAGARPGPHVMLAIADTGCGMDAATISRVFEPFFTTKGVDKGTGLGLSTVYGIVKQSGGEVVVESEPGVGSRFRVYLPRVEETAAAVRPTTASPAVRRGHETILLAEDEPEVRDLVRQILDMNGYVVLEAADGSEALRIAAEYSAPIHLTITDVVMRQIGGVSLAQQMRALRPETKILYMSGYTNEAVIRHGVLGHDTVLMQKPFTAEALIQQVREILDSPPTEARREGASPPQVAGGNNR
jgi:PAS domain S-box-containing protein